MGQEVIRQRIVQDRHAALAVAEPVIMYKHARMLGGVVYVVAISMISGLVQIAKLEVHDGCQVGC